MQSVAERRIFQIWIREIWIRSSIWIRYGYGNLKYGYDMDTAPQIWIRYGYGLIWIRYGYDLDAIWIQYGYGVCCTLGDTVDSVCHVQIWGLLMLFRFVLDDMGTIWIRYGYVFTDLDMVWIRK